MPKYETQWFPGLEPPEPKRPGKIIVTRAEPMTIEESEGIKDEKIYDSRYRATESRDGLKREGPPAAQASSEPVRAPAPEAQGENVGKEISEKRGIIGGHTGKNLSTRLIKVGCSLLAALAALMSWYYSFEWSKNILPPFWKVVLPLIIVGCSILLPQVSLALLARKGAKQKLASIAVFCIGLLASGFSMLSTISGIYNANSANIAKTTSVIISATDYADARAELVRIDEEISRINKEIDSTQTKVDLIPVEDTLKGDSQALMRRLNNAKKSKQDYEAQRSAAQDRIEDARASGNTTETVRVGFNAFLAGRLKVSPDAVEFGMAAAPAVLIDVVAPILSAVALFL